MAKKAAAKTSAAGPLPAAVGSAGRADRPSRRAGPAATRKPSALLDTRVIYCGDCLEQLRNLPDACVEAVNSNTLFESTSNNFLLANLALGNKLPPRLCAIGPAP